ncbi:MAG: LysM peptidoglycan-binding domain-containing protein [Methylacidiphilales bacterium]|nr:LysM peptidoglycan-binding domain-containing protein [Candidatus Methylacidiphilales bacterium]
MRILVFLFSFLVISPAPASLLAQDPGAEQDAEAARQKILKAADQIDMIESNTEATKPQIDAMKADIAQMQSDNTALKQQVGDLKQQLTDLKSAFDLAQAEHAKEQKALLDTIAGMIAAGKGLGAAKPHSRKKEKDMTEAKTPQTDADTTAQTSSASNDSTSPTASATDSSDSSADSNSSQPTPKPQKGYYHIVASGETLTLISEAYRQQGVHVTVADIQKANGLSDKSVLHVGQKLFIPKPGT